MKQDAHAAPIAVFDDATARRDYLAFLTFEAERYPHFASRLAEGRESCCGDCYIPWLLLPGLELERRGQPTHPLDRRILENTIAACRPLTHKNWVLPVPLWILYRYGASPQLRAEDRKNLQDVVLRAKYWMDEPGADQDCYFTENHQVIFHADEYLAGQLFPDAIFPNDGRPGRWHRDHAGAALRRWFNWRARFGFSEWKSMGYSDANLFAFLTLREFAADADLRRRADIAIDLVLLQYAMTHFHGDLACSQGRSSWQTIVRGEEWMPSATCALAFGVGRLTEVTSAAAICLACGSYAVPSALQAVARDRQRTCEVRERESLDVAEAAAFGVDPGDPDSIMFFWGAQLYDHRAVIANSARVMPWPGYYMNERVAAWTEKYAEAARTGAVIDEDPDYTALSRAEQYLYRTPHGQLSCVQDYRPGKPGFGQHIWQATLGGRAVVFTTHPDSADLKDRPNYWSANGLMPRAAACRNVLVCIYHTDPERHRWLATHAYFPRFAFDEVVERDGWVCGRRGDGYIALRSLQPAHWQTPDPRVLAEVYRFDAAARDQAAASAYEWFAPGHANVWICELGNRAESGEFTAFVAAIAAATVAGDWRHVQYLSPSLGAVEFGWTGPLRVQGKDVSLRSDWRISSPWVQTRFGESDGTVCAGGHQLRFDLARGERDAFPPVPACSD